MNVLREKLKVCLQNLNSIANTKNCEFKWDFNNYKDTYSDCYFSIKDKVYLLYFLYENNGDSFFDINAKNSNIIKKPSGKYYTSGKSTWLKPKDLAKNIKNKLGSEKFGIIFYSNKSGKAEGFDKHFVTVKFFNIDNNSIVNYFKKIF